MSNQPVVLVTTRNFDAAAAAALRDGGCSVRQPDLGNQDPAPDSLPGLLDGVDAWLMGSSPADAALLDGAPRLRVLARRGVGYETIDTEAARARGLVVTIAAGGNGPSVADHALGMMLAVGKRLVPLTAAMAAGDWRFSPAFELHGKTVGIVGLGRIGRLVARRLAGFDATVLAVDPAPEAAEWAAAHGVRMVALDTLLAESDLVTLHAPLTAATRGLIGPAALAAMRPDAILINTARGGLVDEAALLAALDGGALAGAGIDVFLAEKDPAARDLAIALARHPHVVATPHSAAATREGLARSNAIAAQCVLAVLAGGSPAADCVVVDGRQVSRS